jgi:hypothetical protein
MFSPERRKESAQVMLFLGPPMPNIIAKLEQRGRFKGRRSFFIQDDGKVSAKYAGAGLRQEVTLQLAGINPNVTRQKHVAVDMIIAFALFLIPALGFLWAAIRAPFGSEQSLWFAGAALFFLLPLGLCWREFARKSFDLLVLTEPATGNRLVIFRSLPDASTVDGFISILQTEIPKARAAIQAVMGTGIQSLSTELERLASLRDRGVLSLTEFQQAKEGLLSGLQIRRIGFHV